LHNWSNFGARISQGQTRTHKTHHSMNLGETTIFPLIVLFMPNHGAYTQMSFCPRTPNLGVLKLGLPWFWRPITSYEDLWLRCSFKKKFSSCWELFIGIWHVTFTQANQGNSRLLVGGGQIGSLNLGLSFGHNLCFKYSNWVMQTHFRHLHFKRFSMV